MSDKNEKLFIKAKAGDKDALKDLLVFFWPKIIGAAESQCKQEELNHVLKGTVKRIYSEIPNIQNYSDFEGWACGIAKDEALHMQVEAGTADEHAEKEEPAVNSETGIASNVQSKPNAGSEEDADEEEITTGVIQAIAEEAEHNEDKQAAEAESKKPKKTGISIGIAAAAAAVVCAGIYTHSRNTAAIASAVSPLPSPTISAAAFSAPEPSSTPAEKIEARKKLAEIAPHLASYGQHASLPNADDSSFIALYKEASDAMKIMEKDAMRMDTDQGNVSLYLLPDNDGGKTCYIYSGDYDEGKRNGNGRWLIAFKDDGYKCIYLANALWQEDEPEGECTIYITSINADDHQASKRTYSGTLENGLWNGEVTMTLDVTAASAPVAFTFQADNGKYKTFGTVSTDNGERYRISKEADPWYGVSKEQSEKLHGLAGFDEE